MAGEGNSTAAEARPLTLFTEEESMFKASVSSFATGQIGPKVREMDEAGVFDAALLRQIFELGLMGIEIPEEYGGQSGSFFQAILAIEEIAAVDPSAATIVDVQNTLVNNAILRWASEEQKRRWLPRLATDTPGSYALSEAGAGSDAFALASRAVEVDDAWILNGRKLWITNASEAGLFLVFANTKPEAGYQGIACFVLERGMLGFAVGKKEDKLGIRASSTCELILEGVRVPKTNVLAGPGIGHRAAMETLNEGRIGIGAQMVGLARGALGHAVAYAKQRKQFGKKIAEFQGIQLELARMAVGIESARLLVYNAARLKDCGQPFAVEAAMAKYYASQVAESIASSAVEILGGVGFTKDYPVEKLYRDAKIGRIYEGTSNMQLLAIARKTLA